MLYYGYMLRLAQLVPHLEEIDKDLMELLSLFIYKTHLSIYQIHKIWKERNIKIAYKNLHKKVQKLVEFKLIERVTDTSIFKKRELERGAKYYKLSEEGIFALFDNYGILVLPNSLYIQQAKPTEENGYVSHIHLEYRKEIFRRHKNCNLFRIFLYPWISTDTVVKLEESILAAIESYLVDCCKVVKDELLVLRKGIFQPDEAINEILGLPMSEEPKYLDLTTLNIGINKTVDSPILSFIRKIFPLETDFVKVKKENKENISISKSDDKAVIKLEYREEEKELDIVLSDGDTTDKVSMPADSIGAVRMPIAAFDYLTNTYELNPLYFKAVFSMVMEEDINAHDLKLLKSDNKFMHMLSEINNRFHHRYSKFIVEN